MNLREMHQKAFHYFDFGVVARSLLHHILGGSDKAGDYEDIIKADAFLSRTICKAASELLKHGSVKSLAHAVVLCGQQNVRDMVFGHTINRLFDSDADSKFSGFEPCMKKVSHALAAEEGAKACGNEYPGLAYACGLVFDVFDELFARQPQLHEKFYGLYTSIWRHSLTTAVLASMISHHPRIFIGHRKIIMASGLLHDTGQLLLAVTYPAEYEKALARMKEDETENPDDDSFQSHTELEFFDLSHAEIGSLLAVKTGFISDGEAEIFFHHDANLLINRNPDAFLGGIIVDIANKVSWLSAHDPTFTIDDLQKVIHPYSASFPLTASELMDVFGKLRAQGLLSTA